MNLSSYIDRFFVGVVISWIGMFASFSSDKIFHARLGFSKPDLVSVLKNSITIGFSTVVATEILERNYEKVDADNIDE